MIPQISSGLGGAYEPVRFVPYPSRTYRYTAERMTGFTDGADAIRQSILHILSIERFSHAIYDGNYGVSLEQYIGKGFGFLEETIQNTLQDALLQDDRIQSVTVNGVERIGTDAAAVSFTAHTVAGAVEMGRTIYV